MRIWDLKTDDNFILSVPAPVAPTVANEVISSLDFCEEKNILGWLLNCLVHIHSRISFILFLIIICSCLYKCWIHSYVEISQQHCQTRGERLACHPESLCWTSDPENSLGRGQQIPRHKLCSPSIYFDRARPGSCLLQRGVCFPGINQFFNVPFLHRFHFI